MTGLDNRVQRSREIDGERWVFRFGNGLVVQTDPFMRRDSNRILPIGGLHEVILNRLVWFPEIVAGKRVFDPFSGSGILGLMALQLGARHVDFLDVNPRAQRFQIENAQRNCFGADRYRALLQSIAEFEPAEPYDVVLANPPFVPTPAGIGGTLTSNGGPEGSDFVELLLARLDRMLRADGEAFVYLMQLVDGDRPLISESVLKHLPERTTEFTPIQVETLAFARYVEAYLRCFPGLEAEIRRWHEELVGRHGSALGVQHYAMHVQPKRPGPPAWSVCENLAEKYGRDLAYSAESNQELAFARVMENVIPAG